MDLLGHDTLGTEQVALNPGVVSVPSPTELLLKSDSLQIGTWIREAHSSLVSRIQGGPPSICLLLGGRLYKV